MLINSSAESLEKKILSKEFSMSKEIELIDAEELSKQVRIFSLDLHWNRTPN